MAINKIDKVGANVERIKQELTEYGLVSEEWGGDTIMVPVSALTKEGLDQLLEMILLVADVAELKANPDRMAKGTIIEARLDKARAERHVARAGYHRRRNGIRARPRHAG